MRRLADLIEHAAGNPANGLPVANHGEAQAVGIHTLANFPDRVLLSFIDANSQSHAVVLTNELAVHLREELRSARIGLPVAPTCKRDAGPRAPITRPSGGI